MVGEIGARTVVVESERMQEERREVAGTGGSGAAEEDVSFESQSIEVACC